MHWLGKYPYLCWCLLLSLIFMLVFIRAKRFRKVMLLSGLASAMYSLSAVFFVPDYWRPVLVIQAPIGLEDMFFQFANGGIVVFISLSAVRDRIQFNYSPSGLMIKYLFCTCLGVLLCNFFYQAGVPVMICCLVVMPFFGLGLLAKNRQHWPISVMGALGFTLLHTVLMGLLGIVFPLFYSQWTTENLMGVRFLGFPIEEYLWAFGFGAVFPLIMACAMGITLDSRKAKHRETAVAISN